MDNSALVLFSGGQDSTICLAWALETYIHVETVGFDYGQRHRVELDCRQSVIRLLRQRFPQWHSRLGIDHMIGMSELGRISESSLTSESAITFAQNGLPDTFVPGRNLLFLTYAAAISYRRSLSVLVGGMCETDFSGYPDCRDTTMKAMQVALTIGMDRSVRIETPLMWLDKASTWKLGFDLGGPGLVDLVRTETHTCYLGERAEFHSWGYGCGDCPACVLRARGYNEWLGTSSHLGSQFTDEALPPSHDQAG